MSAEHGPETADNAAGSDATASPGDAESGGAVPASTGRGGRKGRRLLFILGIIVLCFFVVGGIAGVVVYNEATKIDRSTPTGVARQFLQSALVERDVARVGLFVCSTWSASEALASADLNLDPAIVAAWGITSERIDGRDANVVARVTFSLSAGGVSRRSVETWTFDAVREDGWRVCALSRSPLLSP